jgi:polysaccharide pyruvyl transferase WcaK-like protein
MRLLIRNRESVGALSSPRVAVFGEWNTTNLGDRAIFEGVIEFFEEIGWAVNGYGLGSLTSVPSSDAFSLPGENNLREDLEGLMLKEVSEHKFTYYHYALFGQLKRPLRNLRQHLRIRKLIPQLQEVQAIVVGGGALLSDWDLHFPQSLKTLTWAAKELQIPLFCLGCSAEGEWSSKGKQIITDFAQACHYLATRDQGTATRISELLSRPIDVFGDFALKKFQDRQATVPTQKKVLAVNVMQLPKIFEEYQQIYESVLIDSLNTFCHENSADHKLYVKLFTTGTSEDIPPAKRVLSHLNFEGKSLAIPSDLKSLQTIIRNGHVVVAARLHAAILAISEGKPVIGFSVGNKIERFFSIMGVDEYSLEATRQGVNQVLVSELKSHNLFRQSELIQWEEIDVIRKKVKALFCDIYDFEGM